MEAILRHFMAPRIGRGTVAAAFDPQGGVTVMLEFDSSIIGRGRISFRIGADCLSSTRLTGIDLLYRLSRHAITQAQRLLKQKTLDAVELELDCSVRPWNGDLSELPYGGATIGYTQRPVSGEGSSVRRIAMAYLGYHRR